ncbi:MAG: hypothetical protein WDW36_001667 [Sanguina aurantia]
MAASQLAPVLSSKPLLLSSWVCPYVQRVRITLNHKKVDFSVAEVSLSSKPDWFLQLSPLGKVPVVTWKTGQAVNTVYESLVTNEYLEDAYAQPAMMPRTPLERAHARLVINRFDTKFIPAFYKVLRSGSKEEAQDASKGLLDEVEFLQKSSDPQGPFMLGAELSIVDAAIIPFLSRSFLLQHYRGFDLNSHLDARLVSYLEAALKHEAVRDSMYLIDGATDYRAELVVAYKAYESLISNEFLEDAYPSPAMLPSTPLERAHARIIIGRFDSQFVPAFYKLLRSATREEAVETSAVLVKEVEFLQNNISPTGPYLMGAELTLVDAAVIPFFIRLCVVKHYRGFDLAAKFNPRLASAFVSCLKHESVASSMYLLEGATDFTAELIKAYKNYGKEPVDYFN